MSRINLGDYRFFLGGCKIFGLFLGFGLVWLVFEICGLFGIGFRPMGDLLFLCFAKEKVSKKKGDPTKPLFPFLLKIFLTEG